MKRPMAVMLVFLSVGIIWGRLAPEGIWLCGVCLAGFIISCLFLWFFRHRILILLPCVFVAGFVLSYNSMNYRNAFCDSLAQGAAKSVVFIGKVVDADKNNIVLKGDDFGIYGRSDRPVKIVCYTDEKFDIGDNVRTEGSLAPLSPKYNPSDFDEKLYYGTRGIRYKLFCDSSEFISADHGLFYYMYRLRESIGGALDNMYSPENAGILKAMLLGDKKYLSADIKTIYKNAGIYHILAISGLHISIIAAILMFFFRKPVGNSAVLIMLWGYCIFTGLSPSAARASFMMSVLIFGRLIGRKYDLLSSLCFSAFVILIINPMYIADCGFLYSYLSVLGIGLFAKDFVKAFEKLFGRKHCVGRFLSASLGSGISAVSITRAVNMWFFYGFSSYDFIINIAVLPFMGILLVCGAASAALYAFRIRLCYVFAHIAELILNFYTLAAKTAVKIPGCFVVTGRPAVDFMLLYALFIICLKLCFMYKNKAFGFSAAVFICIGAVVLSLPFKGTEAAFLYVGQGDGIVGRTGGKVFIIDGGGNNRDIEANDEGIYTILPYLNFIGETKVDYVFVSHPDNDHLKGIYEIIGRTDIGTIYMPKADFDSELYTKTIQKAKDANVNIVYIKDGDKITVDEDTYFECLWPCDNISQIADNENDMSAVLRLNDKYNRFLFVGDISENIEKRLVEKDIAAEVLKVGHHGSEYSSSEIFLKAVSPDLAVISCGRNNIYGFPSDKTIKRLNDRNTAYFVTSESGAVIISSDKGKVKVMKTL